MTKGRTNKRIIFGSILLFAFALVTALALTSVWSFSRGMKELQEEGAARLELYTNYLQGVLEKYESLPELLAIDGSLVRALQNPHEKARIETLNRYLETINRVSDTLDTYLMNRDGLTIAASNWNEKHPFIGRNFSYRPYFKQAMEGTLGRYFALGTASSKRGYYFAYPVRKADMILGAVAIKINIDSVEENWARDGANYLVSDPDGVIFITTKAQWRYKTLHRLNKDVLKRIEKSKRYPDETLTTLQHGTEKNYGTAQLVAIASEPGADAVTMLKQSHYMPQAGWHVHILTEIDSVVKRVIMVNLMVGCSLLILYIFCLLLYQRQTRMAQLNRIEARAKDALKQANEQLEIRVVERTQELVKTNKKLKNEVLERKQTAVKLERTRAELIHAAKLAVLGQMSAGINHELNQPLAAIRSYTDNCRMFLEANRHREAIENLERIAELTERMAQIGAQLKLFSRKSGGEVERVLVEDSIADAIDILKPALRKNNVLIHRSITPSTVEVMGNQVLLQQVLVNLIANALHALEGQPRKEITIKVRCQDDLVKMSVSDNGPGIRKEHVKEIFEPFYTTKTCGQGLGLGLTISARIIRESGGTISYRPAAGGGARFDIRLQRAS